MSEQKIVVCKKEDLDKDYQFDSSLPQILHTHYNQINDYMGKLKKDFNKDILELIDTACVEAIDRYYSENKIYLRYLKFKNNRVLASINKVFKFVIPKWYRDFEKKRKYKNSKYSNYLKEQDAMWDKVFKGEYTDYDAIIKNQEKMILSLQSRIKQLENETKVYGGQTYFDESESDETPIAI